MRWFFICLFLFLAGCKGESNYRAWMQPSGKIKVLSTVSMIDDLVRQVGGDYVDSITLIKGELDPHSYQLVKGDDEKLAYAQLVFYNGLGLEHGPSLQAALEDNTRAIALGELVFKQQPDLRLTFQGQTDPHIWMDVSLWEKTIPFIRDALIKADPKHASSYRRNADQVSQAMRQQHELMRNELQAIPANKRYLVTSHDAFNYFTRAYLAEESEWADGSWDKRFAAPEGLAPESQLSTADIQAVIDYLSKYDIHVIFPEANVSKDSIRKIVDAGQEKGMELIIANVPLYADSMGPPGSSGDTYLKMLAHNGRTIAYFLRRQ